MEQQEMSLENLVTLAAGLGEHFGKNCEVIVHDLGSPDPEHTIVSIVNGEISGRNVGDGPSRVVLRTIRALKEGERLSDRLCYLTRTKDGRVLKSSTMFLKDRNGSYRYLFGINYDITSLVNIDDGLKTLISTPETEVEKGQDAAAIPSTVSDLLETLIEQSISLVGKQPALMTKEEKIRAVSYLNDAGAFLITKSGDRVASVFGISKYTLYSYIDVNK